MDLTSNISFSGAPSGLSKELLFKSILLSDKELILYENEKGEIEILTTSPFDESKEYNVYVYRE